MKYFFLLLLIVANSAGGSEELLVIKKAWIRKSNTNRSSLYFQITNNSDQCDSLLKVTSDLSKNTLIQKTVRIGKIMKSITVNSVTIPAKTTINFNPMGINIMLSDIEQQLNENEQYSFTFYFQNSASLTIKAPVWNAHKEYNPLP